MKAITLAALLALALASAPNASAAVPLSCHSLTAGNDRGPSVRPDGWPCKPFVNQARSVKWVRALLVNNGFRPNVRVFAKSPRQLGVSGIQDGVEIFGTVAKTGPRQISIALQSVSPRWSRSYTFTVGFEA